MNRLTVAILLQDQNTRSFRVVRIVFDNDCPPETVDDLANQETVCGELLITVIGHPDVAANHQRAYLLQRLGQPLDPFLFLIIRFGVRLVPLTLAFSRRRRRPAATPCYPAQSIGRLFMCATNLVMFVSKSP
jgi:hypothetical protein